MNPLVHLLGDGHRAALHRHFAQLDAQDLRLRFGRVPDGDWLRGYVEAVDFGRDAVFAVHFGDQLAGVSHLALFEGAAELGLSVLPDLRRRGLATAMFDRAVLHARNRGTVELFMHCLSENQPMRRIARRAGMAVMVEGTDADAWIELPPATPLTVGRELYERQLTLIDAALRAQLELARSLADRAADHGAAGRAAGERRIIDRSTVAR
jgi:GNAT superfamily N-acetyltransferase